MTKAFKLLTIEVMVLTSIIIQYFCWEASHLQVKADEIYHSYDITNQLDDKTKDELLDEIFSSQGLEEDLKEVKTRIQTQATMDKLAERERKKIKERNEEYEEWKEEVYYNTPQYELLGVYDLTAYCKCSICCGQWANTPGTASGTIPEEGRTVAINGVPFGTKVYIEGYGNYVVEDTGGMGYSVCDVFHSSHDRACNFGRKYGVNIYKISYPKRPEGDKE